MKKILLYIYAAALCLLTSCEKELTMDEKLVGDWHCTSTSIDAEIYVTFTAEKTFVLYQQIGEGAYRVYNGIYELTAPGIYELTAPVAEGAGYILSGEYNDGTPWGTSYELRSEDKNAFTLTAAGITETYTRVDGGIPTEVTASCETVVKSEGGDWKPFF